MGFGGFELRVFRALERHVRLSGICRFGGLGLHGLGEYNPKVYGLGFRVSGLGICSGLYRAQGVT